MPGGNQFAQLHHYRLGMGLPRRDNHMGAKILVQEQLVPSSCGRNNNRSGNHQYSNNNIGVRLQTGYAQCQQTHTVRWNEMIQLAAQTAGSPTLSETAPHRTLQSIAAPAANPRTGRNLPLTGPSPHRTIPAMDRQRHGSRGPAAEPAEQTFPVCS